MLRVFQLDSNKIDNRDGRLIAQANYRPTKVSKQDLINIGKQAFLNDHKSYAKKIEKQKSQSAQHTSTNLHQQPSQEAASTHQQQQSTQADFMSESTRQAFMHQQRYEYLPNNQQKFCPQEHEGKHTMHCRGVPPAKIGRPLNLSGYGSLSLLNNGLFPRDSAGKIQHKRSMHTNPYRKSTPKIYKEDNWKRTERILKKNAFLNEKNEEDEQQSDDESLERNNFDLPRVVDLEYNSLDVQQFFLNQNLGSQNNLKLSASLPPFNVTHHFIKEESQRDPINLVQTRCNSRTNSNKNVGANTNQLHLTKRMASEFIEDNASDRESITSRSERVRSSRMGCVTVISRPASGNRTNPIVVMRTSQEMQRMHSSSDPNDANPEDTIFEQVVFQNSKNATLQVPDENMEQNQATEVKQDHQILKSQPTPTEALKKSILSKRKNLKVSGQKIRPKSAKKSSQQLTRPKRLNSEVSEPQVQVLQACTPTLIKDQPINGLKVEITSSSQVHQPLQDLQHQKRYTQKPKKRSQTSMSLLTTKKIKHAQESQSKTIELTKEFLGGEIASPAIVKNSIRRGSGTHLEVQQNTSTLMYIKGLSARNNQGDDASVREIQANMDLSPLHTSNNSPDVQPTGSHSFIVGVTSNLRLPTLSGLQVNQMATDITQSLKIEQSTQSQQPLLKEATIQKAEVQVEQQPEPDFIRRSSTTQQDNNMQDFNIQCEVEFHDPSADVQMSDNNRRPYFDLTRSEYSQQQETQIQKLVVLHTQQQQVQLAQTQPLQRRPLSMQMYDHQSEFVQTMEKSRSTAKGLGVQHLTQDQIKVIQKSVVTNITQHDASLKESVEIQGNKIYTLRQKELQFLTQHNISCPQSPSFQQQRFSPSSAGSNQHSHMPQRLLMKSQALHSQGANQLQATTDYRLTSLSEDDNTNRQQSPRIIQINDNQPLNKKPNSSLALGHKQITSARGDQLQQSAIQRNEKKVRGKPSQNNRDLSMLDNNSFKVQEQSSFKIVQQPQPQRIVVEDCDKQIEAATLQPEVKRVSIEEVNTKCLYPKEHRPRLVHTTLEEQYPNQIIGAVSEHEDSIDGPRQYSDATSFSLMAPKMRDISKRTSLTNGGEITRAQLTCQTHNNVKKSKSPQQIVNINQMISSFQTPEEQLQWKIQLSKQGLLQKLAKDVPQQPSKPICSWLSSTTQRAPQIQISSQQPQVQDTLAKNLQQLRQDDMEMQTECLSDGEGETTVQEIQQDDQQSTKMLLQGASVFDVPTHMKLVHQNRSNRVNHRLNQLRSQRVIRGVGQVTSCLGTPVTELILNQLKSNQTTQFHSSHAAAAPTRTSKALSNQRHKFTFSSDMATPKSQSNLAVRNNGHQSSMLHKKLKRPQTAVGKHPQNIQGVQLLNQDSQFEHQPTFHYRLNKDSQSTFGYQSRNRITTATTRGHNNTTAQNSTAKAIVNNQLKRERPASKV